MKKYYIGCAVLIAILLLLNYRCSSSKLKGGDSSLSSGDSFQKTVTLYFNPSCPHCVHFMPVWKDFMAGGGANFVTINCSENQSACTGVTGVPSIVFSKGNQQVPFNGGRNTSELRDFLSSF